MDKTVRDGDSFGELALQEENGVRSVTVRTDEPSVLAVLSKRNYLLTVQTVFEQMTRERVDFMCRMPTLQLESLARLRTLAGSAHFIRKYSESQPYKGAGRLT